MARTITFTIQSELANVALPAAALRGVCGLLPVDGERLDELEMGVVEALNNVIEHGLAGRADQPIEVTVELHGDRVVVRISDGGTSIPAELLEQARTQPFAEPAGLDGLPESGMGLRLIMNCADRVEYTVGDGINRLRLEKKL